jgi:MarR family transcriptional regulator, lower aerobic nicotinate degradation pathway regulator
MSETQRILDAVRKLVRLLRLADRAAQRDVGLSGAQLFVLQELGRTPSLSLNDLAERTSTDQSSVSVVVTRLVDAGLVSRDRDTHDARRLVLNLTKPGRTLLQKAPPVAQEQLIEVIERMPAAERRRFAETFEWVLAELGAERGAAPMLFEDNTGEPQRGRAKGRRTKEEG